MPASVAVAAEPSVIVWFLQRGRDVVAERGRHIGRGSDDPAEPGHRGDRQQHVGDLVLARARRQRPASPPFQADRRGAEGPRHPTCSKAAVLGSRVDVPAGSSPSLASSSTKPSSIIASLRNGSWNLAVWPIHLRPPSRTPLHLVPGRIPSPRWHERPVATPPGAPARGPG